MKPLAPTKEKAGKKFHDSHKQMVKLDKIRFVVVIAYGLSAFYNSFTSVSYAAIQEASAIKYGVSQQSINLFCVSFEIMIIPGSILCIYMFK